MCSEKWDFFRNWNFQNSKYQVSGIITFLLVNLIAEQTSRVCSKENDFRLKASLTIPTKMGQAKQQSNEENETNKWSIFPKVWMTITLTNRNQKLFQKMSFSTSCDNVTKTPVSFSPETLFLLTPTNNYLRTKNYKTEMLFKLLYSGPGYWKLRSNCVITLHWDY